MPRQHAAKALSHSALQAFELSVRGRQDAMRFGPSHTTALHLALSNRFLAFQNALRKSRYTEPSPILMFRVSQSGGCFGGAPAELDQEGSRVATTIRQARLATQVVEDC